jgi:hypothetical protein
MKKIVIIFALIACSTTVFAQTILPRQTHIAPECTKAKYPKLYTAYYEPSFTYNGDTMVKVCMTVPLKNIIRLNDSTFAVIHPVFGNECVETISFVKDTDMSALATMTTYSPERIEKISVSIRQILMCGTPTGDWKVVASTHSN